jgi:hypothetical protein
MSGIGGRPLPGAGPSAFAPLAAARAWKRAVDDGRALTGRGGDRSKAQSALCIKDPRRRFSDLFRAGERYTEQAYALVTRDPAAAETVAKGEHVKAAYEAPIARADLARPAVLRLGLHGRS